MFAFSTNGHNVPLIRFIHDIFMYVYSDMIRLHWSVVALVLRQIMRTHLYSWEQISYLHGPNKVEGSVTQKTVKESASEWTYFKRWKC